MSWNKCQCEWRSGHRVSLCACSCHDRKQREAIQAGLATRRANAAKRRPK